MASRHLPPSYAMAFFFQRLQGNAVLHQLTGLLGQPRGGIPGIQTYRGPRTHPLCRGTRAHPGYVGLAEAVPTNPPRRNVLRSAPLMITNPTIEFAAGDKGGARNAASCAMRDRADYRRRFASLEDATNLRAGTHPLPAGSTLS